MLIGLLLLPAGNFYQAMMSLTKAAMAAAGPQARLRGVLFIEVGGTSVGAVGVLHRCARQAGDRPFHRGGRAYRELCGGQGDGFGCRVRMMGVLLSVGHSKGSVEARDRLGIG